MNEHMVALLFVVVFLVLGTLAAIGPPSLGDDAPVYSTVTSELRPLP